MRIQINLELSDAMHLIAAFANDNEFKGVGTQQRGEAVIEKIADQLDVIVTNLEAERGKHFLKSRKHSKCNIREFPRQRK